jgi:hypothetical protein
VGVNFFAGYFFDLRFEGALFGVAQFAGAGDLRFGESHAGVEFFLQLLDDPAQELDAAVIDQHGDQISDVGLDPFLMHNCVQELALLIRRDGWIFPHAPQIGALGQQALDAAQPTDGAIRVEMRAQNNIGESASVGVGNGSHGLVPVLSRCGIVGCAQLSGKISN